MSNNQRSKNNWVSLKPVAHFLEPVAEADLCPCSWHGNSVMGLSVTLFWPHLGPTPERKEEARQLFETVMSLLSSVLIISTS